MLRDVGLDPLAVIRDFPRVLVTVHKTETNEIRENINDIKDSWESNIEKINNNKHKNLHNTQKNNEALATKESHGVTNPLKKPCQVNNANWTFLLSHGRRKGQANDNNTSSSWSNTVNNDNPLSNRIINKANTEVNEGNNKKDSNSCNRNNNDHINVENESTAPLFAVNYTNFETDVHCTNENKQNASITSSNDSSKNDHKLNEWRRLRSSVERTPWTNVSETKENTLQSSADHTYHNNKSKRNTSLSSKSLASSNIHNSESNNLKKSKIKEATLPHKKSTISPWLTKEYDGSGRIVVNVPQKKK